MEKIWLKNWPNDLSKELVYPHGKIPVFEYLRINARKFPDKAAIIFYGKEISYKELDESSDRFANYLIGKGLNKGDRVGIFMGNCPQYIIAVLGVHKMGGIVCPISAMFKEAELKHEVNDAQMTGLVTVDIFWSIIDDIQNEIPSVRFITTTNYKDYLPAEPSMPLLEIFKIPSYRINGVDDFMEIMKYGDPKVPSISIDMENDIALFEYTGGTTGLPKGAMLTHLAHLYKPLCIAQVRELNENSVELTCMPYFHIAGMTCLIGILIKGATNICITQFEPNAVMTAIDKYKATSMYTAVPAYLQIMQNPDVKKFDLSSLTVSLTTSFVVSLNEKISEQWAALTGGCPLLEASYGLSETHTADTFMPKHQVKYGSVGIPTFDNEIKILDIDDKTKEVPVGEQGEIAVRNQGCMKGYWNKNAETEAAFLDGFVLTGDIGKFDEDGFLWWLGRYKEMIKVSGFSVFPEEVEAMLNQHPDVLESAVIPVQDTKKGEVVKAFVVLKADKVGQITPEEIINWSKLKMTSYKAPVYVEFRETLPKSGVKLLRRLLRE
jgi:long-chain acyl-CoA synthetase